MGVMGQNILHCIVWKNTKESEHLTQIPKPHLSTSLTVKNGKFNFSDYLIKIKGNFGFCLFFSVL